MIFDDDDEIEEYWQQRERGEDFPRRVPTARVQLVVCDACGHRHSSADDACPNCGSCDTCG